MLAVSRPREGGASRGVEKFLFKRLCCFSKGSTLGGFLSFSSSQPSMSHIWIVGSGVVGQATGRGFLKRGQEVTFVDVDDSKIAQLRSEGLTALTLSEARAFIRDPDVIVLTVPTPTTRAGAIDLSYLETAAAEVGRRLKTAQNYQVVVVRSTVVPGTTEAVVKPILEEVSGKQAGKDFGLCMNPEYLREKTAVKDFDQPRLMVIGQLDERSGDMLAAAYENFGCPIHRLTIQEAELQKYAHNLFNAVKISYFNEFREICRAVGADAEKIFPLVAQSAEGMWNSQYGIRDLGPFDGICLPKDAQAFLAWAGQQGLSMPVLQAAVEFNHALASVPQREQVH